MNAMKPRMKRWGALLVTSILLLAGCTPLAMETFARGVANLLLSPFMIIAGLAQGLAFLPYTTGTSLAELNRALLEAQAVPLDDAYRATYGVSISDPRVDPQTGQVAGEGFGFGRHRQEAIFEATRAFQRILVMQGMPEEKAQRYIICANYTRTLSRGHILLSVVYRHPEMQSFRAVSKHTGIVTTFRPDHRGSREPYEQDVNGQVIDEVIDWAGIEYVLLRNDKAVAMLMVLGAESVKSGKRSPDYWEIERRWMAGETAEVMRESFDKVGNALAVANPGLEAKGTPPVASWSPGTRRAVVRPPAPATFAGELQRLWDLKAQGRITDEEYEVLRPRLIGTSR
jgi:hypothetical protein